MVLKRSDEIIEQFLKNIRLFWQVIFLLSVSIYGLSFLHYLNYRPAAVWLFYFKTIDLSSFALALALAIAILLYKRKYFSLRKLKMMLTMLHRQNREFDESQLVKQLTTMLRSRLKGVWLMGLALIVLGIIFYWWTFTTKNMHIYFIVGLYSLVMNYPRKDLFADIPYLAHEVLKEDAQPA